MGFTLGLLAVGNIAAYLGLRYSKRNKAKKQKRDYDIAFARFESKIIPVNEYLHRSMLFYQSSFNTESRINGLVIIEGYIGLPEHIF
jgi:hypothetical protein